MQLVRAGLERLLLRLFGAARSIFLFQGVAFGCAWLAARAAAPADAPAWLRDAMLSALLLSGTFFVAGILLIAARGWRVPQASGDHEPAWPWPLLLGLSLLAFSGLAASAASGLSPLWSEIATQLDAIGFWDGLKRNDPFGGIVLLPILLALFVPALVTAAAFCQIVLPLALLPLLPTRSRLFPTLLAMGVVCQAALVLGGWLATDTFARLAEQAHTAMAAADDAEVMRVAEQLRRATAILSSTATALVLPLLGLLAWLAVLRPSGAAAAFFTEGASPAAADAVRAPQPQSPAHRPSFPNRPEPQADVESAPRPAPAPSAPTRRAHLVLAALGALMLLFGAADALRTRASYVSSQPAPGGMLEQPPATVRVSFGAALDPASSLSLTRLVLPPYTGEQPKDIEITRRLALNDPGQRTFEAVPSQLPAGVYRVRWQALPAGGGVPRFGSFCFGVGVPVPADTAGVTYSLQDRDADTRGRRHTFAGGALLLALGMLAPRFSRRS
jgi:methionine-rich copper-binding protein CopC